MAQRTASIYLMCYSHPQKISMQSMQFPTSTKMKKKNNIHDRYLSYMVLSFHNVKICLSLKSEIANIIPRLIDNYFKIHMLKL